MDIDVGSGSAVLRKNYSVPSFLRKMFRDEVDDDGSSSCGDHRLLVLAVHAILLESGFIEFGSPSGKLVDRFDRFHIPDECPSLTDCIISLWYTLPQLITSGSVAIETVVLKFESLGKSLNVHGSLARNGAALHRLCLDEYRFEMSEIDRYSNSSSYPESKIYKFWRTVNDGLALPLLIDLCDMAGLAPPLCLMRLPTELKLKILEFLPGVDVAKVGCVCTELRHLSYNNDLWKKKFVEEFGTATLNFYQWKEKYLEEAGTAEAGRREERQWRERFASSWERRKKRKKGNTGCQLYPVVIRL
ncbi:hypothetical protein L1049_015891 [Liquidambar formosana]|uniref:F-box domain-containing protein n=1 Tax=Liquidambar formosana TaxID=63359 RepID=A0AAP0X6W0_LIQFO